MEVEKIDTQQKSPAANQDVSLQPRTIAEHDSGDPLSIATSSEQTIPQPVVQQTQIHIDRKNRHSKRLSLNFPVAMPSAQKLTDAPSWQYSASPLATPVSSGSATQPLAPSNRVNGTPSTAPLTPPSEILEDGYIRQMSPNRRQRDQRSHMRSHTLAHAELNRTSTPQLPATSPSEEDAHLDFLTLLAGQERRVLELKEELNRAETELNALKRQWAVHEANKKKGELKNGGTVKMDILKPSPLDTDLRHVSQPTHMRGHARSATLMTTRGLGLGLGIDEEDGNEVMANGEREKRRSLMQERLRKRGTTLENDAVPSMMGRRTGQRVFSGSRHTRTLSLLTTTPDLSTGGPPKGASALEVAESALISAGSTARSSTDGHASSLPSLTRSNSGFGRDLNFGKTYKDLATAASRRTIPQGADVLMKHGKVMVDGVRDGLWSFFEDIRQATVGEEAAREISAGGEPGSGPQRKGVSNSTKTKSRTGAGSPKIENNKLAEQSFWREFGIETPKPNRKKSFGKGDGVAKQKSIRSKSANSACPKHNNESHHVHDKPDQVSFPINKGEDATATTVNGLSPDTTKDQQPFESKQKKDHHISHSSTDSGDSRDSHNTPSLTMDSPFGGSSRTNDTDIDDGEDDTIWDWKESDSPAQVRSQALLAKEQTPSNDRMEGEIHQTETVDSSAAKRVRGDSQATGYDWHALTR